MVCVNARAEILRETEVILPAKVVEALRREQLRRVTNTPKRELVRQSPTTL
jgi:hypothetical protein